MAVPDLFPGTFVTYIWEAKLLVRRRCVEGRLAHAKEQVEKFVEWRNKYTYRSEAWQQYDAMVKRERDNCERELDELRYIKGMSFSGPIVGGEMHVPGENGYQGPSIIDLFHRVAEKQDELGEDNEYESGIAEGIRRGLEILTNPYKFLDAKEREAYDLASKVAQMVRDEDQAKIQGHGTAKTGPVKRGPGRPPKTRNIEDVTPKKITFFHIGEDGKGVLS